MEHAGGSVGPQILAMAKRTFYSKPTCSTCRKAKGFLTEQGIEAELVDLNKGLSVAQLDALIGTRDYRKFLNTRNELYRERKMKDNPPSRDEALKLMSQHPNLIKRPLLVSGSSILFGFDAKEWGKLR